MIFEYAFYIVLYHHLLFRGNLRLFHCWKLDYASYQIVVGRVIDFGTKRIVMVDFQDHQRDILVRRSQH